MVNVKDPDQFGNKHTCASCEARFYDMGKEEPKCPRCGVVAGEEEEVTVEVAAPVKVAKKKKPVKPQPPAVDTPDDEEGGDALATELDQVEDVEDGEDEDVGAALAAAAADADPEQPVSEGDDDEPASTPDGGAKGK